MIIAGFEFDPEDGLSVLAHAKRLEGRSVGNIILLLRSAGLLETIGKGQLGQVVQTWFGVYKHDNKKGPDLAQTRFGGSDKVGLEIKVVPMRKAARNESLRAKERNVVGNINYLTLPGETWRTATVRKKLEHVLFIFYLHSYDSWLDAKILRTYHWCLATEQKRQRIELDWVYTQQKVAQGFAHELHEGDTFTEILRTCRHGAGGTKEKKVPQLSSLVLAYRRAFTLKPGHLDLIWYRDVETEQILSLVEELEPRKALDIALSLSAQQRQPGFALVEDRLRALEGKRLSDLDPHRDWSKVQKNAAALVLSRALGERFVKHKIEEFVEEQLIIRVLPVMQDGYKLREAVSFPAMKLSEFAEEEWDTSTLKSYINLILFITTLLGERPADQSKRRIGRSFFWSPTDSQMVGISGEWRRYQEQVRSGLCKTSVMAGSKRVSSLMKESETTFIHMRPHAKDGDDVDVDPLGNRIVKQSFWLNKAFVRELLIESMHS